MKLIKNKNEISNNINEANSDSLVLTREVAEKLDAIIGTQEPEKGGFLFGDNDTINEFIYDYSADTSAGSYSPDTEVMTPKINVAIAEGKTLRGMFHSHPKGYIKPSTADVEYAKRIMAAYELDDFIIKTSTMLKKVKTIRSCCSWSVAGNIVFGIGSLGNMSNSATPSSIILILSIIGIVIGEVLSAMAQKVLKSSVSGNEYIFDRTKKYNDDDYSSTSNENEDEDDDDDDDM